MFDNFFALHLAFAMKSVLAVINDFSWQNEGDNSRFIMDNPSHTLSEKVISKTGLSITLKNMTPHTAGIFEISQFQSVLDSLIENGEVLKDTYKNKQGHWWSVYCLSDREIRQYITPRTR